MKLTKKSAYGLLAVSIACEQLGTGCLEACAGFTKPGFTVALILSYIVCYWCFAKALKHINLSVSYATWTAVGTIGAALMGIVFFHQHLTAVGWGAVIVMVAGVFLLNLYGTPKDGASDTKGGAGV